jgi:hypothetical protein
MPIMKYFYSTAVFVQVFSLNVAPVKVASFCVNNIIYFSKLHIMSCQLVNMSFIPEFKEMVEEEGCTPKQGLMLT